MPPRAFYRHCRHVISHDHARLIIYLQAEGLAQPFPGMSHKGIETHLEFDRQAAGVKFSEIHFMG